MDRRVPRERRLPFSYMPDGLAVPHADAPTAPCLVPEERACRAGAPSTHLQGPDLLWTLSHVKHAARAPLCGQASF